MVKFYNSRSNGEFFSLLQNLKIKRDKTKKLLLTILAMTLTNCGLVQRIRTQQALRKAGYGNCQRVSDEYVACVKQ